MACRNLQLEVQLTSELNLSRIVRGSDLTRSTGIDVGVDRGEVRMIEGVKELCTELEAETLGDLIIFDGREIPKLNTGTKEIPIGGVSEVADGVGKGTGGVPLRLLLDHMQRGDLIRTRSNVGRIDIDATWVRPGEASGRGDR
jgi:hypothetical protein